MFVIKFSFQFGECDSFCRANLNTKVSGFWIFPSAESNQETSKNIHYQFISYTLNNLEILMS